MFPNFNVLIVTSDASRTIGNIAATGFVRSLRRSPPDQSAPKSLTEKPAPEAILSL
jgi:hypothetical protein